jgi:hypothetical protein
LYRPPEGKGTRTVEQLLETENKLYEEFERCAAQLCDVRPGEDWEWEWYFLMQHHGVPTRLLDWTDGALIGLHFALRNKSAEKRHEPAVWVLDPYWLNDEILKRHLDRAKAKGRWKTFCAKEASDELDPEEEWDRLYLPSDEQDAKNPLLATPAIPLLWDSPHVTRRVAAQRSRFMIFGTEAAWLSDLAREQDSRIVKLRVEPAKIQSMKIALREAGVTESVIYPDLDGLGRELEQFWEALP